MESDTTLSKVYWGKDGAHDILFQRLHSDCKVECLPTPCSAKIWNACHYPQSCSSVRNSKQVFKYNPETATVGLDTLFLAARGTKHSVRIRPRPCSPLSFLPLGKCDAWWQLLAPGICRWQFHRKASPHLCHLEPRSRPLHQASLGPRLRWVSKMLLVQSTDIGRFSTSWSWSTLHRIQHLGGGNHKFTSGQCFTKLNVYSISMWMCDREFIGLINRFESLACLWCFAVKLCPHARHVKFALSSIPFQLITWLFSNSCHNGHRLLNVLITNCDDSCILYLPHSFCLSVRCGRGHSLVESHIQGSCRSMGMYFGLASSVAVSGPKISWEHAVCLLAAPVDSWVAFKIALADDHLP